LQEFYQVAFRRKLYHSVEELQADLNAFLSSAITSRMRAFSCLVHAVVGRPRRQAPGDLMIEPAA
jgi:hypothetical protein